MMITNTKNFQPSKVTYKPVKTDTRGGKSVALSYNGQKLTLKVPIMLTWGANEWQDESTGYCKYDMAPGRIIIRTSTLNDSENFPPQAHIFTRSKVPWITLDDKIPSFESMYDRNKLWPKASLDKLNSIL